MFLHDKERDNKYPIFEDENGTHIMSPNDVCIIDELEELIDAGIDSFKIDGVLKTPEYLIEVTKMYREAIDLCVENRDEYEAKKKTGLSALKASSQLTENRYRILLQRNGLLIKRRLSYDCRK